MDHLYMFVLGLSVGVSTTLLSLGHTWLGLVAAAPIGLAVLLMLMVVFIVVVHGDPHESEYDVHMWK